MQKEIFAYMFPGMMIMWVFFIAQTALADIYHEREHKTLMRMFAAPVTIMHVVLSKFAYCFTLCILVQIVLIVLTTFLFGIDWGNPLYLIFSIPAIDFAMTGVLALIYGVSRKKEAADGLVVIVILFLGFLSGSFFPFEEMPQIFQKIGAWTVNRWAILAIRAVMESKPFAELGMQVGKLLICGFFTMGCGMWLLKRRFERGEGV